jgi:hypothetical protein
MAERLVSTIPSGEKSGNVTWVECPGCHGWIPVDPKLIASSGVKLICPHCASEFMNTEAPRVI